MLRTGAGPVLHRVLFGGPCSLEVFLASSRGDKRGGNHSSASPDSEFYPLLRVGCSSRAFIAWFRTVLLTGLLCRRLAGTGMPGNVGDETVAAKLVAAGLV